MGVSLCEFDATSQAANIQAAEQSTDHDRRIFLIRPTSIAERKYGTSAALPYTIYTVLWDMLVQPMLIGTLLGF